MCKGKQAGRDGELPALLECPRPTDVSHARSASTVFRVVERHPGRAPEPSVEVEIHAERSLVDGVDGDVRSPDEGLDDGEVDRIRDRIEGSRVVFAQGRIEPNEDVVGRAVGRKERADEWVIGERSPSGHRSVGAVVEAAIVERELDVGDEAVPVAIAVAVPG